MGTAAATLRILATALPDAELPRGVPHLEAAQLRLANGIPALEGEPLLSGPALLLGLRALETALTVEGGLELPRLADTLERRLKPPEMTELAAMAQAGAWDAIGVLVEGIGLEPDTAITFLDHAARPVLRAAAAALQEPLKQSHWSRGTCPACSAAPLLGELRGGGVSGAAEHERVLRCGRCATAWSFPRLRCTRCGETNHRRLAYLHGRGEESYRRAETCASCQTYLKSIAVLAPLDVTELLSADLTTAVLDISAVEHGFHR
jgi:formate dehydrogenase accessory protein FdhE